MSEAGNSLNLEKRAIAHVLNLDVNKIHNIYHKKIADNLLLQRRKIEDSNSWSAEDCHLIISYMCEIHNKLFKLR